MDKESFFISNFSSSLIGDDGAVIGKYVYSKDVFAQGVHFELEWMSLRQIAIKSMLVNLSDAVAMNAKPWYALLGLVVPKNFTCEELKELALGFEEVAQKWGVHIIGGDTTSGEKLVISVSIIAETQKPIYRKGLKTGHFVAFTGSVGESKKALIRLLRGGRVSPKNKFITPRLKDKFFYHASKFVSCGMDVSDGLGKDLHRLCKANHLSVTCREKNMCSGEEYEMLFGFDPRHFKAIKRIAQKHNTKINIIGKARRGRFYNPCKEHHF